MQIYVELQSVCGEETQLQTGAASPPWHEYE